MLNVLHSQGLNVILQVHGAKVLPPGPGVELNLPPTDLGEERAELPRLDLGRVAQAVEGPNTVPEVLRHLQVIASNSLHIALVLKAAQTSKVRIVLVLNTTQTSNLHIAQVLGAMQTSGVRISLVPKAFETR